MIVNTPDGQVNFPDSMSDDDVKGVLQKKYGAPTAAMPAAMTSDPSDPNASWGSWALSKLHNAAVGGNQFNRVLQDSATFGGLDKAQSLVPGSPSVDQLRAQTEQSRKDIGPVASGIADIAGYAAGPGELKVGEGVGNLIGRGILGRVGGSAVEGGSAAALGTLGHGDTDIGDIGKAAGVGGLIGGVTGALPGGAGERPTTPSTADLQSTASGLYKPLESKVYQSPDVAAALDKVGANVSQGLQSKISSNLSDQIDRINRIVSKGGGTTASDIADFRSSLQGASRGKPDQAIVGQYLAELEKRVGPNMAAKIDKAAGASNVAKTSGEIEGWAADPSGAPKAVKSALEANPQFYSQPGLFDALNAVGKKAPSSDPSISSEVGKAVGKHLLGMAAGGAAGYLFGGNPLEDIAGAALGAAVPSALGRFRSIPTRNALLAAQHLNATGMKVDPSVYTSMGLQVPGILARQTGYGLGASGAF